jgi:hypothetical protein
MLPAEAGVPNVSLPHECGVPIAIGTPDLSGRNSTLIEPICPDVEKD